MSVIQVPITEQSLKLCLPYSLTSPLVRPHTADQKPSTPLFYSTSSLYHSIPPSSTTELWYNQYSLTLCPCCYPANSTCFPQNFQRGQHPSTIWITIIWNHLIISSYWYYKSSSNIILRSYNVIFLIKDMYIHYVSNFFNSQHPLQNANSLTLKNLKKSIVIFGLSLIPVFKEYYNIHNESCNSKIVFVTTNSFIYLFKKK